MACGVATIGSDSGAIPEVLGDAHAVFPHSNTAGLADLLRKIVEDPAFRSELAEEQHRRALKRFSHRAVAQSYTDFLISLTTKAQRTRREDW
jgi:L-malate glycosyltransferase